MSSTQEVGDIFGAGKGPAQAMLRSPTVLIVSVGLWGMNLFFFRLFNIDYRTVLNYDLIEMDANNESETLSTAQGLTVGMAPAATTNTSVKLKGSQDDRDEATPKAMAIGSVGMANTPGSKCSESTTSTTTTLGSNIMSSGDSLSLWTELDYGTAITWFKLVVFCVVLLCLLHFTTHFWMDHLGRGSIGAVFSFYGAVLVYIFLPLQSNQWLRRAFVITLQRSFELVNPRCSCIFLPTGAVPRKIPFVDVFYADAMCSLSKVFFDWGMLLHQASHYPEPVPPGVDNIILPSALAAVPYIIRARQCLIMYTVGRLQNDPKRCQHVANAIKYSTSLFPLLLSAYQKTVAAEAAARLDGLLVLLLIINATYSLYWDIVMDWGMMQDPTAVVQTATAGLACYPKGGAGNKGHVLSKQRDGPCHHVCLRPRLRFGLTLSTLILVADSFLRFSWTLKLVGGGKLFPSNDAFVLCTQFLEVFRRAIWNLLRVEWENIKQKKWQSTKSKGDKAHDSLSDHGGDDDIHETDDDAEFDEFKPLVRMTNGVDGLGTPGEGISGVVEMKSLLGGGAPIKKARV